MKNKIASHSNLQQALSLGPAPEGNLAIPVFAHGSMEAELYTPEKIDPQSPHSRDEIYIVANGSNFTEGFAVWVIFYGPVGGESNA